jgi:hypothetical protein
VTIAIVGIPVLPVTILRSNDPHANSIGRQEA